MIYTVKQLADLSGVSPRTLRYYDEINLLKPAEVNLAGYRLYKQTEVDRLQQILVYRSMGLPLKEIRQILDQPEFKIETALHKQQTQLLKRRQEIDELLLLVDQTLAHYKGEQKMTNEEKFELFKQQSWQENEEQYGEELLEKYGEDVVKKAAKKWSAMSQTDFQTKEETEQELLRKLKKYGQQPELPSDLAKQVFLLHKKWLQYSWQEYSSQAHRGVAEMYILDERFTEYYEIRVGKNAANWLRDIIKFYA
ncbi:MerR family transcriptional regulator [Enterococcus sp. AZ072]|uniref:MerR family transcriptional regulator n=1 Tax=unclassified Enterococcus TaxID=2608891 RepID=UPI003D29FE77